MFLIVTFSAFLASGFSSSSTPTLSQVVSRSIGGSDTNRPQKVNQDAFFHVSINDNVCLGVMDGHGFKGHLVTQFMSQQLPKRIAEQLDKPCPQSEWEQKMKDLANFDVDSKTESATHDKNDHKTIHNALRHAFHQTHVDAIDAEGIPAGRSGTTCIACLIDDEFIHVAHVGDSRALRVRVDGSWEALTTETTTSNLPADVERIQAGEGRTDGQGNVWYGPVGISMTRALGDAVMLRAGVVPTPMVQSFPREPSSVLVVATDGIWDVLNNDQVSEIVRNDEPSLEKIANQLAAQARQKWIGDLPGMEEKVDDITCIVAKL